MRRIYFIPFIYSPGTTPRFDDIRRTTPRYDGTPRGSVSGSPYVAGGGSKSGTPRYDLDDPMNGTPRSDT